MTVSPAKPEINMVMRLTQQALKHQVNLMKESKEEKEINEDEVDKMVKEIQINHGHSK